MSTLEIAKDKKRKIITDNDNKRAIKRHKCSIQKEEYLNIVKQGLIKITDVPLVPQIENTYCTVKKEDVGIYSNLAIFQKIFNDQVEGDFLESLNIFRSHNLDKLSLSRKKRYSEVSTQDLYQFIGEFFFKHLSASLNVTDKEMVDIGNKGFIGKSRYSAIHSMIQHFDVNSMTSLEEEVFKSISKMLVLGSIWCGDETLLKHTGKDAKILGIRTNIKGKPHPIGILVHDLAQKMKFTNQVLFILLRPELYQNKETPTGAMEEMIKKVVKIHPTNNHFIFDRGFSFPTMVELSKQFSFHYTMTGRDETVSLQDSICKDLKDGQQRTFLKKGCVYEFSKVKKLTHCSITNAFLPKDTVPAVSKISPKDIFKFFAKKTPTQFCILQNLDVTKYKGKTTYELIKDQFRVDVLKPWPNPSGQILWTEEGLKYHSKPVLKAIAQKISTINFKDKKNKKELVKLIIQNHPDSFFKKNNKNQPSATLYPNNCLGVAITRAKSIGNPSYDPVVHEFYLSNYYFIDKCNDLFYRNIQLNFERSIENDVISLILFQVARAAYAIHMEIQALLKNPSLEETYTPVHPDVTFKEWLKKLLVDIQSQYPKKFKKQNKQKVKFGFVLIFFTKPNFNRFDSLEEF